MKGGSTGLAIGVIFIFVVIGAVIFWMANRKSSPCPIDETGKTSLTSVCDCFGKACLPGQYCYDNECKDNEKDLCNPDPCNGNGSCTDGNCSCNDGFSGENCETEVEACDDQEDCNGNGVASGYKGSCSCECDASHSGSECLQPSSVDLMDSPCAASGLCHGPFTNGTETSWSCVTGYYMGENDGGGTDCIQCPSGTRTSMVQDNLGARNVMDCVCNNHEEFLKLREDGSYACESCGDGKNKKEGSFTGREEDDCECDNSQNFFDDGSGSCRSCPTGSVFNPATNICECQAPDYETAPGITPLTCEMNVRCLKQPDNPESGSRCGFMASKDTIDSSSITETDINQDFKPVFMNGTAINRDMIDSFERNVQCRGDTGNCICPDGEIAGGATSGFIGETGVPGEAGFIPACSACKPGKVLINNPSTPSRLFSCENNPCLVSGSDIVGLGCINETDRNNLIVNPDNAATISFYKGGMSDGSAPLMGQEAVDVIGSLCSNGNECVGSPGTSDDTRGNMCSPLNDGDTNFFYMDSQDNKCKCKIGSENRTLFGVDGVPDTYKQCNTGICSSNIDSSGNVQPKCDQLLDDAGNVTNIDLTQGDNGCVDDVGDANTEGYHCVCADGWVKNDEGQCTNDIGTLCPGGDSGNPNWDFESYQSSSAGNKSTIPPEINRSYKSSTTGPWIHECSIDAMKNPFTSNQCKFNEFINDNGDCELYANDICSNNMEPGNSYVGKYLNHKNEKCSYSGNTGGIVLSESGGRPKTGGDCCMGCDEEAIINNLAFIRDDNGRKSTVRPTRIGSLPVGDLYPGYNSRPMNYDGNETLDIGGSYPGDAMYRVKQNLFTCSQTNPHDQVGVTSDQWGSEPGRTNTSDYASIDDKKENVFLLNPGTGNQNPKKIWRNKGVSFYTNKGHEYSNCTTEGGNNVSNYVEKSNSSDWDQARANAHKAGCVDTKYRTIHTNINIKDATGVKTCVGSTRDGNGWNNYQYKCNYP
jgi:hypothetical protein